LDTAGTEFKQPCLKLVAEIVAIPLLSINCSSAYAWMLLYAHDPDKVRSAATATDTD
jgi:hypothetical protein